MRAGDLPARRPADQQAGDINARTLKGASLYDSVTFYPVYVNHVRAEKWEAHARKCGHVLGETKEERKRRVLGSECNVALDKAMEDLGIVKEVPP